uniref:DNA helicase n=1 Tax=Iridovirus LCIVAC01 TaxID=2506607 RepID=A0A481YRF8_9VIRU|nr:MAG: DNA helicase [Iridovirus LCIVAC01]
MDKYLLSALDKIETVDIGPDDLSFDFDTVLEHRIKCQDNKQFISDLMEYMNNYFSVVIGGSAVIYLEVQLHRHGGVASFCEKKLNFFKQRLEYCAVKIDDHMIKLSKIWLEHRQRMTYNSIDFCPDPKLIDWVTTFNMYQGLAISPVEAKKGKDSDINPILNHILEVWCQNDKILFNYVLDWMALIIQKPWIKTKVAIVLHGEPGCGKGIIVQKFGEIIGQCYKDIHDVDDVLGRFTGSNLKDALVLFLDEVVWGGDKKSAGKLKKLVTETTHRIEQKNLPVYTVKSFVNIIMASNEDWIVPAIKNERRWLVLECNNKYAGISTEDKYDYFSKIVSVPAEAFAYFLYKRNVENFIPTIIPKSKSLQVQKELSLNNVEAWWLKCLNEANICERYIERWDKDKITKKLFYETYKFECQGRASSSSIFWRKMKQLANYNEERLTINGNRQLVIILPSYNLCKQEFKKAMKEPDWIFQ